MYAAPPPAMVVVVLVAGDAVRGAPPVTPGTGPEAGEADLAAKPSCPMLLRRFEDCAGEGLC